MPDPLSAIAPETVLLVAAMASEIRHARDRVIPAREVRLGPWHAWQGEIAGVSVIALQTGIGMVNAAAAVATVLSMGCPRAIINFGCAGAHRRDIEPGDVVVGTGLIAHGSMTVLPDGREQYDGFRYDVEGTLFAGRSIFPDPELLEAARVAADGWLPPAWPGSDSERQPQVVFGPLGSADCWTQHPPRIEVLHRLHGTLCEEMEAAAVAQVAAIYRVPFLAVKDISNNELLQPTTLSPGGPTLHEVRSEVGARSFALIERMLETLARQRVNAS